jgi:hypothetical protein
MTVVMTANEVREAIEIATIVGGIVAMLIGALVVYLLVRPIRGQRGAARPEADSLDREEMVALMDRMERRLEVMERLVVRDAEPARIAPQGEEEITKAVGDRELGRTK